MKLVIIYIHDYTFCNIYICMYIYINAVANSVMLHLYLWYDFTTYLSKIKYKPLTSSGSVPPSLREKAWVRACLLLWCLQFLCFLFFHISLLLWCPPIPTPVIFFFFSVLHWWVQFLRLLTLFSPPTSRKHKRQQLDWFLTSPRTNHRPNHPRNNSLSTGCLAFFLDGLTLEDGNDRLS